MADHNGSEVALVTMPFAELATPSVAIGILKSALDQAGISTRVVEAQILFAERIGPGAFQSLKGALNLLAGDWMFSKAAFPDFAPDDDEYLDRVGRILCGHDPQRFIDHLLDLRYEAGLFVDDLARQLVEDRPRIVGCTSVFQQHCAVLALLRRIKELDPSILTMIGGSNCESEMGKATLVSFDWVDVVVSGDADDLIAPLCRMLLAEGPGRTAEELPPGVFAHDHRRRWLAGEELPATRHVLRNMEDSPVPDYDGYFDTLRSSLTSSVIFPGLPIETSRGCWWGQKNHCTFCGIESGSMRFRSKSADRVLAELEELVGRYRVPRIKTVDLILDMAYFKDLLPRLAEEKRGYKIFFEVKANLSRERMKALREAGVLWIQPGFESLHDEALQLFDKGTTAATNVQALKWAREQGIWVIWSILTELPGERAEWYSEMAPVCELLTHLQPPMTWNAIEYHRFSPYHRTPERFGLELAASWMHYYVYPVDGRTMQDLAYRFQDVKGLDLGPDEPPPFGGFPLDRNLSAQARELMQAIAEWRDLFFSKNPPAMTLSDEGDHGVIRDTRPCAPSERVELRGVPYRIYRFCEAARTRDAIARELAADGVAQEEVEAALADLCGRKLLAPLSDRYLALATCGEPLPLPDNREYPEGFVIAQYDEIIVAGRDAERLETVSV